MARWQRQGLSEPERIAFRWAQFPPEQEYEPEEWNQGMLAVGLPTTYVLDGQGKVIYRAVGGREFDHPDLIRRLRGHLPGK